jgi:radical SAM/Cys-rich protein
MHETLPRLEKLRFPAIRRRAVDTLQMNLGYLCNLACLHCHVAAGPTRRELMDWPTMETALAFIDRQGIGTLDLTGGSPEMNPHFRRLVQEARDRGVHVMDRCNPTILVEPGYEWAADFLAGHQVEVIASLPCYSQANVDAQRGNGVFEASIRALKQLNGLGYGKPGSGLRLNLVYNPVNTHLPPDQDALEADYHRLLGENFGIVFDRLFAIANMPIKRWGSMLISKGQFDTYLDTLANAHRDANLEQVMCRDLISVDWQGYVYDCDFNQMLGLPLGGAGRGKPVHLSELLERDLDGQPIRVSGHCFGCTAGQGSSCGGALE